MLIFKHLVKGFANKLRQWVAIFGGAARAEPYILACQACFPNASITIDRFHVVKALNHTLDTYRKTLRKEHPQQEVFKDIKWVLFKSKIDLQQQQKLDDAFKKAHF